LPAIAQGLHLELLLAKSKVGVSLRYKAVIFDLDGTLLNTLDDIGESANGVLAEYNLPACPINNYKLFIGNGAKNLIRRASKGKIEETELDIVINKFRAAYALRFDRKTKIYPGIENLLTWLQNVGIPFGVLSNKSNDLTNKIIKHYFPSHTFFAICGQKTGIPIKPDPTQANNMISTLKYQSNEFIFVGDSGVDMDTAHNAGIYALGVMWGFREKSELEDHRADFIVSNPEEIRMSIEG